MNAVIAPQRVYALEQGPARDQALFYHVDATVADLHPMWDHIRFCCSNLVWINDHFLVTPNPLYLCQADTLDGRLANVVTAVLQWYAAKRLVADLVGIDMLGQPL